MQFSRGGSRGEITIVYDHQMVVVLVSTQLWSTHRFHGTLTIILDKLFLNSHKTRSDDSVKRRVNHSIKSSKETSFTPATVL